MQFFNLRNQETFHFVQWALRSGQIDVDGLIVEAFDAVGTSDFVEMDLATAYLAKEHLAKKLRQSFVGLKNGWLVGHDVDPDRYTIDQCVSNDDYAAPDALLTGLMEHAAARVCFNTAAEALLRATGKWLAEQP